jgi:hypothetical protein
LGRQKEIGKWQSKGTYVRHFSGFFIADFLKAIHDLCNHGPTLFVQLIPPISSHFLSKLLANTPTLGTQVCYRLGGFIYSRLMWDVYKVCVPLTSVPTVIDVAVPETVSFQGVTLCPSPMPFALTLVHVFLGAST